MTGMTVVRWKRYGKDRLYVNTDGGEAVGYRDLLTGQTELLVPHYGAQFQEALRAHDLTGEGREMSAPNDRPCRSEAFEPYTVEIPWRDLARNSPGQAARQQAIASRKAAPLQTVVARVLRVHTDERAWRIGADGEEMVASELARLPNGWQCMHAIPVGDRGADIDHLVVGPGGVYVINAKHHPDKKVVVRGDSFHVNGYRTHYVKASRREAARASQILTDVTGAPVPVTGVIAVVGAHEGLQVLAQPPDVHVIAHKRLLAWLTARPVTLNEQQVTEIFRAARRSDTWRPVRA